MVWGLAGSTTLSSGGVDVDITCLSESKNRMIMSHMLNCGAGQNKVTFNDTGSGKYASRNEYNDCADSVHTCQNYVPHWDGNCNASNDQFVVSFLVDVCGQEKLGMYWGMDRGTAGAGNTIRSRNMAYKFVDTPKITRFDLNNIGAGTYAACSNLSALGSEITPAAAVSAIENVQDNSLFVEKENARRYWFTAPEDLDFSATSTGAVSNQPTDATEVGQLITSTTHRGKKAKSATFYVKRLGSPGGTMVYKIRKSSDNSVVATSTGTAACALSTSTTAVTLDFNNEIIPCEDIRVTVSGVTGSSGNLVTIYGGGADVVADQTLTVWGGSCWTEYANDAAGKLTFTESWLTSSGISKTGCLVHYNFEDTGDTLSNLATTARGFTDGLGASANGTNGGATQSQTGVVDNAWSFDNSNDYVNTNISTVVMDTPKTFSISMWIKPNSSSCWSDVLVGQSVGTTDQGMVLWLNSLKPTLYLEGSGGGSTVGLYAPATNTVSTGVWNHVVITVVGQSSRASDATGINIYLNGTSQTISTSGSNGTVGTMGVNSNMFLGSKHGTTGFFDGLMDEVSIWNRVLTQAEVTTLYNSGKGVGV